MRRVRVVRFWLRIRAVSSHPMWAIEENAMIFRVCVWLRPAHPPMQAERRPSVSRIFCGRWLYIMSSNASGASFCHVDISNAVGRVMPWSTSGYQACTGASPSFIARAISINRATGREVGWRIDHWPEVQALSVLANRIVAAAAAWVRKYFVAASVARGWWCFEISGIMASVFISRPSQARSQWWLDIVIIVPVERLEMRIDRTRGLISIGRIVYQHCRGMGPKA